MEEFEFDPSHLEPAFKETIESRRELIADAAERILGHIHDMPCARENLDAVHLALVETLANAIIHGNKEDPSKRVTVWGACEGGHTLLLVVTDEGAGFDPSSIPDPTTAENIYSDHGRGLFLINRLMSRAEYRLGGRQVVLRKHLAPPA